LRVQGEYSVCKAAQGGGRDLRQADALDLAGGDQIGQGPDAVLDRHPPVQAMQVIEVDDLHLQPRQAFVAGLLDPRRRAVQIAGLTPGQAAFRGQHEFIPPVGQDLADQPLIGAQAIEGGGVEKAVASVEPFSTRSACSRGGGEP
jgi:hypothetical protein